MKARILSRDAVFTTPYFTLVGKHVAGMSGDPYYSLDLPEYVSIVATTTTGEFVLVRQFRPAVESVTLELPAGLVDPGTTPEATAIRELREETGYVVDSVRLIGCLKPDTGRLSNRMWVFLATDAVRDAACEPEPGIEVVVMTREQLAHAIADGTFDHAQHVAALLLSWHVAYARPAREHHG